MNLLIKNVEILGGDPAFQGKSIDILIKNGIIEHLGVALDIPNIKIFDATGMFASIGWVDIGVSTGDPGYEHREDLSSVTNAAAAGGFTAIASWPNTLPVIDSKSGVLYVKNRTDQLLVEHCPIGAISVGCEGQNIAEMLDMHHHGAIAFSDGTSPVQNNALMMRALEYVKTFNGILIQQASDLSIAVQGQIHEGLISAKLGMKGIPSMAEELMIARDLYLCKYTDSRLHFSSVSSKEGIALIREAKQRGLKITASVAVMNLLFDETKLENFDAQYKVLPPLRSTEDRQALIAGLKDGTIDMITSNHVPLELEAKKLEFPFATFGASGLETTFSALNTFLRSDFNLVQIIEKISLNPRKIFGLPLPEIKTGAEANLTIFDPSKKWTSDCTKFQSKSSNTPFHRTPFTGKVIATINNNQIFHNPN